MGFRSGEKGVLGQIWAAINEAMGVLWIEALGPILEKLNQVQLNGKGDQIWSGESGGVAGGILREGGQQEQKIWGKGQAQKVCCLDSQHTQRTNWSQGQTLSRLRLGVKPSTKDSATWALTLNCFWQSGRRNQTRGGEYLESRKFGCKRLEKAGLRKICFTMGRVLSTIMLVGWLS